METHIELSVRERQVLLALAMGLTHAEAGELLHISPNTIKSHRRNTWQKLGTGHLALQVLIACHYGWIGYC